MSPASYGRGEFLFLAGTQRPGSSPSRSEKGFCHGRSLDESSAGPIRFRNPVRLAVNTGVTLATKLGEPVQAVGGGMVMPADRLRGYGNLLVLNHGKSFYSLYAHRTIPTVRVGEKVKEGQTIAWVGEGGMLGRPAIYFELRHPGKPVDPMRWLQVRT